MVILCFFSDLDMEKVYLLLGSNLGDRNYYLKEAFKSIELAIGKVERWSSFYETESWGKTDQPNYINQVLISKTNLEPTEILEKILHIEKELGRERNEKWGSRTIDIDILFYGSEILETEKLTIPHPELHKRRFTLAPLLELNPNFVHPVLSKTIKQLYTCLTDKLFVNKIKLIS